MDEHDPLILNVHELLETPGSHRPVVFDAWVSDVANELVRVESADPIHFDLELQTMDEGILVRGTLSGHFVASCRRCLEEVRQPFSTAVSEVYRPPGTEVWEEEYVISNEHVDLHPLVRDNVTLDLPLYPVCREDCQGLCPICGQNRNRGQCRCQPQEADPRWGALKGLLDES